MNTTQHLLYDGSPFASPCDGSRNVQTSPVPFVPGSGDLVLRFISAATFRPASVAAIAQGASAWRFVIAQNLDRYNPLLYATDAITTASGGAGPDIVIDVSTAWTDAMRDAIGDRAKAVFLAELTGYASAEDAATAASPVFSLSFPVCAANRRDDGAETSPARDLAIEALRRAMVAKDETLFSDLTATDAASSLGDVKLLVNTLLTRLKNMMTAIVLALCLASCVPAYAQTPQNDVPGTNAVYTVADTAALASNLNVRAAPTGAGVADSHGCVHDAPVAIGEGARAAPDGGGERAVSVAIGADADATDPAHPEKSQAIAIGNQSRAAAVNSIAIGSGVRHDDEDDMSGANAYAAAPQAGAAGYAAKAIAEGAWQVGTGTNDAPWSIKFFDTWLVKDGKVVGGGIDSNAVEALIRERVTEAGYATLRTGVATNGYAYAIMSSYDAATDTDGDFRFYAATNPAVAAPLSIQTSGGLVRIYSEASVDRLIAEAIAEYARTNSGSAIPEGVATTNDIAAMHPEFQEWASPTVDRIAASAVAPSTTTAQRGDTYVTTGAASGYALRAVRSVRSSAGMDSETEIPGTWSIVGNTTAANLTSNVLSSTSTPGDVTVEFAPSGIVGAPTMRAVVSMPGDVVRTATTWPAGEGGGWRSDKLWFGVDYDGSAYTTSDTTWSGRSWVCTNWAAAADPALMPAWYASRPPMHGGGLLGVAPHYALSSTHCGEFGPCDWPGGSSSGRGVSIATFGDIRLLRMPVAVPAANRATFLRASVLATLSDSQLFRWLGVAHTQHHTVAPCLIEPRPSRADLSGLTWDNGWTYVGADKVWRNDDLADMRQWSHAAHQGDSGHPVWFWLANGGNPVTVPVGLFHWADGGGECLLSDTLLDKIDAAIKRDSGGVESLSFYTAEELQ